MATFIDLSNQGVDRVAMTEFFCRKVNTDMYPVTNFLN